MFEKAYIVCIKYFFKYEEHFRNEIDKVLAVNKVKVDLIF